MFYDDDETMSYGSDMAGYENNEDEVEYCTIAYDSVQAETPKAWLLSFVVGDGIDKIWVPKSECHMLGDNEISVPYWLMNMKGLWDYEVEQ